MIRLLITGGTIDVKKITEDDTYIFDETYVPDMLTRNLCFTDIIQETLFLKNSLYMTKRDREDIYRACKRSQEEKIVITHETDTMCETARFLGERNLEKVIVLLGSMIPYNQNNSDASFNLGSAISTAQVMPTGVYIAMNGRILEWDNVRKNKEKEIFETIK